MQAMRLAGVQPSTRSYNAVRPASLLVLDTPEWFASNKQRRAFPQLIVHTALTHMEALESHADIEHGVYEPRKQSYPYPRSSQKTPEAPGP